MKLWFSPRPPSRRPPRAGGQATHLTLRCILLISFALAGCTDSRPSEPPTAVAPSSGQVSRTIESFRFIGSGTTVGEVTARLGAPDRDLGSGLYVYGYELADGSEVRIGSADGTNVLYVRHGRDTLFEGPQSGDQSDNAANAQGKPAK